MNFLIGRNHARELMMQRLREAFRYKPSVYGHIYDSKKILFIHIPKNAGTSIAKAIYGVDPWHWTAEDLHVISPRKYRSYFKFAVVRNPWSRVYSTYQYSFVDAKKFNNSPLEFITKYSTFESFVMDGLTEELASKHFFLGWQINYLKLKGNYVDPGIHIGRLEDLKTFISHVQHKVPDLKNLGRENVSLNSRPLTDVYNDAMVSRIQKLYEPDVSTFEYRFPKD